MDEVEFIERVLCRLDLPDQEVYPALARIRDARRAADKPETHKALSHLALVFTTAVRKGLDQSSTGWNLWKLLSNQRELRSDPEMRDTWLPTVPTRTAGFPQRTRETMAGRASAPAASLRHHGRVAATCNDLRGFEISKVMAVQPLIPA